MSNTKLKMRVETMLANEDFQSDFEVQDDMLNDLRDDIKDAETPQWIIDALTAMHATYPEGQSLRYRSSTNNEDLPNFNGAGLYDSKTQHPEETEEAGIDKSLKQVFASLWTFRAFTEREFHRIDHLAVKMGVLVHPNYSDELANGVAVSFDPIYGRDEYYYVNTQLGEDLVTNPEAHSVPEELLLRSLDNYTILATSNLVEPGQLLMSDDQLRQLRAHLEVIHDGTVKLSRIRPFCGRILLDQRPRINDLAVAAGGENAAKLLNLTVPSKCLSKCLSIIAAAPLDRRRSHPATEGIFPPYRPRGRRQSHRRCDSDGAWPRFPTRQFGRPLWVRCRKSTDSGPPSGAGRETVVH